ncbi:MAG: alkaline phosphatase family protein [Promethearchaeota archaeon]
MKLNANKQFFPDYKGHSIVNLMSTILNCFGGKSPYPPLEDFPNEIISSASDLILIVLDGMGYKYVQKHGEGTIFKQYLRGKMTSIFPSTTASAMLSYYTGLPAYNTGIPAWFTYLKELGLMSTILPFTRRGSSRSLEEDGIKPGDIYTFSTLFESLQCERKYIFPKEITESAISKIAVGKHVSPVPYATLEEFSTKILEAFKNKKENNENLNQGVIQQSNKRLLFGYWPGFDSFSHKTGINSPKTLEHFKQLNAILSDLITKCKQIDPTVRFIISADHGLIDTEDAHRIDIADHIKLQECLSMPLAGEPRVPFFYVRPDKVNEFTEYMHTYFNDIGTLVSREEAIRSGIFGNKGLKHPSLSSRIGDFLFLLHGNYVMKDFLLGEEKELNIGNHGGVSEEEMFVPLIVI